MTSQSRCHLGNRTTALVHSLEGHYKGKIMNHNDNTRPHSRRVRAALAALVLVFALGTTLLVVATSDAIGHVAALELLSTPTAQNLTASGYCAGQVNRPVCKEMCQICADTGAIIPMGQFVCMQE